MHFCFVVVVVVFAVVVDDDYNHIELVVVKVT